ncbi:methyltransferase domain-containing protein [Gigaspora rosea]|uniref:Methyltransferase domain-containing protein n=1 Tax=Gigaspora rosea TaxID=44941 RepID=A0A397UN89_9GLOM|nr:methyltransferase domain-containing protein [Gigaspora rosea]
MQETNGNYKFTYDWFKGSIPNWEKHLLHLKNEKINVLEIGAFEGRSTVWILEELFKNPESKLISVDPFEVCFLDDGINVKNYEMTFRENVKMTGKEKQSETMKSLSFEALTKLNYESKIKFDFIYIDGSHIAKNALADAVLAWNLLKDGGIMTFDDYEWDRYKEEYNNPKVAINTFIKCYEPELEVIHKGFQVTLKKVIRERKQNEIDDFAGHIKQVIKKFFSNYEDLLAN